MSISQVQVNWSAVSFTPTGGSATNLKRITAGMFGQGGQLIKFKGDANVFPILISCPTQEPHCSFTSADIGTFMGISPGTVGAVAAQLNDMLAVTGGAVDFAGANAVFENADGSDSHAQAGSVTATWQLFSSDGTTNPVTITRV